jgi:hypothetical protein
MNTKESFAASSMLEVHSEQPVPLHENEQNGPSTAFFVVGAVINIVMITAYFIWAYKQWKKKESG